MAVSRGRPTYVDLSGGQSPNNPGSPSIMAPSQVNCHCGKCNFKICSMWNAWVPCTKILFTYEHPSYFRPDKVETLQEMRAGSPDTELGGCVVRPICCGSCKTTLGVRCVEAPEGKFLLKYVLRCSLTFLRSHNPALFCLVIPLPSMSRDQYVFLYSFTPSVIPAIFTITTPRAACIFYAFTAFMSFRCISEFS